ncbi:hypothetical protein BC936DRAFT_144617 [Jimgerdemannia flammicorona]|uniref:Uncharacterized protein n=2 Tax=Jimgerdemannia flammicorona TaxID=994334 RepID=A0A433P5L9_9FUNG|nr:hypothetical protein BC936DRAFT_144617 [Jimgerdemannia flammicorona]RUS12775.1 hypothetical protein BC938DRAFT_478441 [Jimgerdemannia flammicorona]
MLTLCVTNATLGIISDLLAQSTTYVNHQRAHTSSAKQSDQVFPSQLQQDQAKLISTPFDPWRMMRFAMYGFCIAPVVGKWFQFLDRRFPLPAASVTGNAAAKAAVATLRRVVSGVRVNNVQLLPGLLVKSPTH